MAYMDEEARKTAMLREAQNEGESAAMEAKENEYVDSESRRNKPVQQGRNASVAEEQQLMIVIKQGMQGLQQVAPRMIEVAKKADPAQVVAQTVLHIIESIGAAASSSGVQLSDELKLTAGMQLAVTAATILAGAGIIGQSKDEIMAVVDNAVSIGREMAMQSRG
jgi:hypothetical protein